MVSAARFAVKSINELTKNTRNMCAELYLKKITYAESLIKNKRQMIKVQFVTSPNKGIYESILLDTLVDEYEFKSQNFSIKSKNEVTI